MKPDVVPLNEYTTNCVLFPSKCDENCILVNNVQNSPNKMQFFFFLLYLSKVF